MNIYFNDLTLDAVDNANTGEALFSCFKEHVLKPVLQKTSLTHICCNELKKIKDKCLVRKNGLLVQTFHTFFRAPYVDNDFSEPAEVDQYSSSDFFLEKDSKKIKCHDLGCAVIKSTITLGLPSEPFWNDLVHDVLEENSELTKKHRVLCLTIENHVLDPIFVDWVDKNFFSEPEKTLLSDEEKEVHLRDDHGKDKLEGFSKKVLHSQYVIKIVNSLPFHPNQKIFIDPNQSFESGLIEICLHWTPQGLGMVLQTTAKNKYQAQKIAEMLTEKYDQNA